MRTAITGAQFRRDVKLAEKRGKDMSRLRDLIELLIGWHVHLDAGTLRKLHVFKRFEHAVFVPGCNHRG